MEEKKKINKEIHDLIDLIQFMEKVSTEIHGVLDKNKIYTILSEKFAGLKKYSAAVVLLADSNSKLKVAALSIAPEKLKVAEKLGGFRLEDFRIDVDKSSIFPRVIREEQTIHYKSSDLIYELFPQALAVLISKTIGYGEKRTIMTPLRRHGKIIGALAVTSPKLAEYFISSLKSLAQHISAALELSEEHEERKKAEEDIKRMNRQLKAVNKKFNASEQQLRASNEQLIAGEQELLAVNKQLDERVKDLNCLYGISKLIQRRNSLEEILQGTVNLIIPSWTYSLSTCARITVGAQEFKTGNFKETVWKQTCDINVYGKKEGAVEVYYLEEKPQRDEGPFLKEERYLLKAIAEVLGRVIERRQAMVELNKKESAIHTSINAIAFSDLDGNITYVNLSFIKMWGYKNEKDVLGKPALQFWQEEKEAQAMIKRLQKRGSWVGEMTAKKRDGSVFDILMSATVAMDENNEAVCMMGSFVDITEFKKTKENLEEQQNLIETIFNTTPTFFTLKDKDSVYRAVNSAFCNFLGKREKEIIGKTDYDLFPHEEAEKYVTDDKAIMEDGQQQKEEWRVTGKSGNVWLKVVKSAVLDEKTGESTGVLCSIMDISNIKKAEEALKESEEKYRSLVTNIPDVIWTTDQKGKTHFVSQNIEEIYGYSPEEIKETGDNYWFGRIHPDDIEKVKEAFKLLFTQNRKFDIEYRVKRKDGKWIWLHDRAVATYKKDGIMCADGVFSDITERKIIEDKIRESREKYKLLIDNSGAAITAFDKEGNYTVMNKTAASWIHGQPNDFVGKKSVHDTLLKEDADKYMDRFERIMSSGKGETFEETIDLMDGRGEIWISSNLQPVIDSDGNATGVQIITYDITDQKRAEKEKAILEEQLRHGEKLRAIGELAGGIAHDFNNILGAISGYADLIDEENHDENDNEKDAVLGKRVVTISRASKRATDLISKLLAFSRRGKYRDVNIDIHKVIDDVMTLLEGTIESQIRIERKLNAKDTFIKCDPSQIQNAILNIAINARDAMKDGGGVMLICTQNETMKEVHPYLKIKAGDYLVISINDTGMGMDEETKSRIFEPFFSTKGVGEGTGLGLASVYGTMQSHGGCITVESKVGIGAKFTMYLPLSDQKEISTERKSQTPVGKMHGTILIVDDEEMFRNMTADLLTKWGYTIHTCGDGAEAIAWYEENYLDTDLVILDMVMPIIGGFDCFKKLKEINPDVKVLLASGYSKNTKVQKLLDLGALDFMQKPFNRIYLSNIISEALKDKKISGKEMNEKEHVML